MSISGEPWTEEEQTAFIGFLVEKAKNAKSPLIINQLCREYKQKSGSSRTLQSVTTRIKRIRSKIPGMWDFDIETKVKIAFALGAPIGNVFLKELPRESYLELDDQNRIISYKKKDNSYKNITVNGTNLVLGNYRTKKENEELIKFIAEKSMKTTLLFSISKLSREFIENFGTSRKLRSIVYQICSLRPIIPKLDNFDTKTKVRMLFSLSAQIGEEYLNELRKIAVVEVDDKQRITKFIANDGSLDLDDSLSPKRNSGWEKRRPIHQDYSENEDEVTLNTQFLSADLVPDESTPIPGDYKRREENWKLINFIGEKSKIAKSPFITHQLSTEFIKKFGSSRTMSGVTRQVNMLRMDIADRLDFSTQTEVRLAFALSIPVDKKYLNILQENAIVEFDKNQRITKYEAKNKSLKLEGVHKPVRNHVEFDMNKRRAEFEMESEPTTLKPSSSKKYKTRDPEDSFCDSPEELIAAELPIKIEPNLYDELFWQEEEYKPDLMDLLETSVPEQSEVKLEPIEYQEQIVDWEEQEYKPDIRNLLENPITDQSEMKLEPIEYREQIGSWQKKEYKPNPLELATQNPIDRSEFQDFQFLDNNLVDRSVKKEEPEIGYDSQFAPHQSYLSIPGFSDVSQ